MAIRGETIGIAYVRILADGKGLPAEIRRELKDAEPGVSEAGAEHSKAYEKGWEKQSKRNKGIGKNIKKDIDRAFGEIQADADFLSRGLEKDLSDAITNGLMDSSHSKQARQLGDRIAKNITDAFARTGTIHFSVSREIDKALGEIRQEADDFEKAWRRDFDRINTSTERTIKDINSNLGGMGRSLRGLGDVVTRFRIQLAKDVPKAFQGFDGLNKKGDRLRLFSDNVDRATDKFGRAFGKGSRNDAVNFFGSIVGGLVNMVDILPKAILKISEMGSKMRTAFTEGGGGFSGFTKAIGPLMANLAILGAALVGIVLVAGPVASMLFGIAGAILAVASALAFASTAVLGVMGALVFPLIGAIGVLGLAFTGMGDRAKETLKNAFRPMKEEFKDLQKIAQKGIFSGIKDSAEDFGEAFKGLRPLVRGISNAVGDVIRAFADSINSPGMRNFIETMSESLPGMITTLGGIFTNVVGGFGGLFAAAIPIAQRFLGWFESITQRFQTFTNSKKGKNELVGFFDRAAESAGKVFELIGKVGEVLGKLLFNEDGREAGGTILDDMSDGLDRISTWLDAHPDALKDFFTNGVETMRSLGGLITSIASALDALDTPENREIANKIFGAIAFTIELISTAINNNPMALFLRMVRTGSRLIARLLDTVTGLAGKIAGKIGEVDIGKIITGGGKVAGKIIGFFQGKAKSALKAMGDLNLRDIIKPLGLISKILGYFTGLVGRILSRIGKVHITDIIDVGGVVSKIVGAFAGLGSKILSAIGDIDLTGLIKVPGWAKRLPGNPFTASGGIFFGGQTRIIGEAGPEAVVPLNRPLGQVDPAVRALSAIAQGIGSWSGQDSGRGGVNVGGLTIITPTEDPRAVARETINRLAAASY